jgi:hypothetical protein
MCACSFVVAACDERVPIPAHVTEADLAREKAASDPRRWLTGGERVFFDDFERAELGASWVTSRIEGEAEMPEWRIDNGWVRTARTKNQGIFAKVLPTSGDVRIELLAASDPPIGGKGSFDGDLKVEAFSTEPEHEKGYSFINGGWKNTYDTIAKLGEHSADERRKAAKVVEAGRQYRYAVVMAGTKLHWFRDGELLYTFEDPRPVRGPWLGLNNWLANARFDEVAVFKL